MGIVISVVAHVNPLLRVALCHVMSVPAVVMAWLAVRVSVSAAAGASMRSRLLVRDCWLRLVGNELNSYALLSSAHVLNGDALHFACHARCRCHHCYEIA